MAASVLSANGFLIGVNKAMLSGALPLEHTTHTHWTSSDTMEALGLLGVRGGKLKRC